MTEALPCYEEDSAFVKALENWAREFRFAGALGIDSYLYREKDGRLAHRTLCEINPRFTMGRVAHEIRKQVAPAHGVRLEIRKASEVQKETLQPEFSEGRLSGGSLLLTELHPENYFAAVLHVGNHCAALRPKI